jgi:hypothetical protein
LPALQRLIRREECYQGFSVKTYSGLINASVVQLYRAAADAKTAKAGERKRGHAAVENEIEENG